MCLFFQLAIKQMLPGSIWRANRKSLFSVLSPAHFYLGWSQWGARALEDSTMVVGLVGRQLKFSRQCGEKLSREISQPSTVPLKTHIFGHVHHAWIIRLAHTFFSEPRTNRFRVREPPASTLSPLRIAAAIATRPMHGFAIGSLRFRTLVRPKSWIDILRN